MQIKQNLVTYINRFKVDKIENLFIVTQSPHIKEIIEALSLKLKDIKISIFDPFNKLKLPAQITDKLKGEDNKSSFTASVGLATRKLDIFGYYKKVTGVQNINLLPNREVVKKTQRTKLVSGIFVTIIIVMILSFSGYYGYSFWNSLSENEVELKEYDVTKAKVEEKQLKLFVLKNKVEKLNKEISLSDTATTNQHTASAVLEEILKVMGNPYLLSIDLNSMNFDGNNSYEIKGVAVMSQIVKNSTKKNISADKTVIEYISRLKKNPIFSNASLVKSFLDPEQPEVCLNKNCTIKTEKKNFIFKLTVKKDLMNLTTLDKK
jgi:type IV pilus assembly protein PilN